MTIVNVPWIKLPKGNYKQLKNGTKGIIFKLSPQYVAKVLYRVEGENYWIRDDNSALDELNYEYEINETLFENGIGNVPRPLGVKDFKLYGGSVYPAFIMEYIRNLPHGDNINDSYHEFNAKKLVEAEIYKALDIDMFPGRDFLHPWNYFYDKENCKVRLIDFGRWVTGELKKSPYDY
jgi:gamma-glutamylcyclotransferase (GGCT)/AIG2-like uncharacterized protein YtfP